ncbi:UDP-3-O-acyl-N-acetylglucosamine deacetylase [Bartonella sp. F02]|uniref:UDP-3-O-acyl-N-acetylglucosamine deacetylase n=1 Tax=Bartonella sp. F02 TaxID=2967262 RepID=UPI0022A97A69|nr:UDP-3-O-acyl-N-acetylglucosamine deacetylase [Bartonella sp. F02]MCZ2328660.1 UDP-3-O-acyl-N-acetylglucosamine deacetylase [Bartonella sp. F02]
MNSVNKYQSTLKDIVTFEGYGVHSGERSVVKIYPADIGHGIVFKRCGLGIKEQKFLAHAFQTGKTTLSTTLGHGDVRVETIEHLMAAIAAYNLDNLVIEVSSNEVPILDGSSWQYCQSFEHVGVMQQSALRTYFIIKKPVRIETMNGFAEILPFDGCQFDVTINFSSPAIGKQQFIFDLTSQKFRDDLSRARTFGFLKDLEQLQVLGKGLGSSLENSLIFDLNDQVMNPTGLYFEDECVRHKMLDAIGDTALLGAPFIGLFRSYYGGHKLNSQLVKAVLVDESCYEKSTL